MKQTFKNFWAHRRQNGFVLVEIALATLLSFSRSLNTTTW